MTRVLSVLGGLDRGGAETWMIQVLRGMKDTGIQVDFLVHTDGPFHYQAEAEALGSRVIVCRGLRFPPLYALNLLRILRKYGPYQVIHSHSHHFSGIILLVAAIAGVPVRVVQSHSDTRHVDAEARRFIVAYTQGCNEAADLDLCDGGDSGQQKSSGCLVSTRLARARKMACDVAGYRSETI